MWTRSAAILCAFGSVPALAGGGANVFALGDYVVDHPWGTFLSTVFIIFLYIGIEHSDHLMNTKIKNQFVRRVLNHIVQEIKNFGILSLLLFFCVNFITNEVLILLLDWVHMVLFIMACMFLMGITILFAVMRYTWRDWLKYEGYFTSVLEQGGTASDIAVLLKSKNKQAFYNMYQQFRLQASRIDPSFAKIHFCRYMMKAQRDFIIDFVDLNEKSWASLAILTFANSLRGVIMEACGLQHTVTSAVIFVLTIGFAPLLIMALLYYKCRKGYRDLTGAGKPLPACGPLQTPLLEEPGLADGLQPANFEVDHRIYFLRQDPLFTLQLMQIVMLCMMFYTSVILLSMGREMKKLTSLGLAACSFIPPGIFLAVLPGMLQRVTILACTGNLLDTELLYKIKQKDDEGGGLKDKKKSIRQLVDLDAAARIRARLKQTFVVPLPFHLPSLHGDRAEEAVEMDEANVAPNGTDFDEEDDKL